MGTTTTPHYHDAPGINPCYIDHNVPQGQISISREDALRITRHIGADLPEDPPQGQVTRYFDPATGRGDAVRLIQTTDELLSEVLRRPGQFFGVSHGLRGTGNGTELEQWTYLEFADGDKVEVRYVR